jgi:hypothetical protein
MKIIQFLALTAAAALIAGCAPWYEHIEGAQQVSFNQMTPSAQETVRREIGNQPIMNITREYKYGDPSYRVEVDRPVINPTLWVAGDGSIIKQSRRLVGANMPPAANMAPPYEAAGAQTSSSRTSNSQTMSTQIPSSQSYSSPAPNSPSRAPQSPRQSTGSNY